MKDTTEIESDPKNDPLTMMWIMRPRLSGSTVWDVDCGDDCEDPSGALSGQEAGSVAKFSRLDGLARVVGADF